MIFHGFFSEYYFEPEFQAEQVPPRLEDVPMDNLSQQMSQASVGGSHEVYGFSFDPENERK